MSEKICFNCMRKIESDVCPYCGYNASEDSDEIFVLRRGTILKGRYMVGKVMGQGGFGITYVGYDMVLDLKVAVKEYYPRGFASRNTAFSNNIQKNFSEKDEINWDMGRESFLKEAKKLAKLKNIPLVVGAEDAFYENETAYIVMDFVEGINLREYIRKNGVMETEKCIELFLPLICSLSYVHDRGIVHRDISPDNIMVKKDGSLCLLDLGAAKDITLNNGKSSQLVAKEGYSPIEQYTNTGTTGPWTDVYALCATILYTLSGKKIPSATDRVCSDTLNIYASVKPDTPDYIKNALGNGLMVNPQYRIQNMKELETALSSKPVPPPEPEPDKKRRTKEVILLAVICVSLLLSFYIGALGVVVAVVAALLLIDEIFAKPCKTEKNVYGTMSVVLVKNYKSVEIPAVYKGVKVTRIEIFAFRGNSWLKSVTLPEGIEYIGSVAFRNCKRLPKIRLPKSLNEIKDDAFYGCCSLKDIWCSSKISRSIAVQYLVREYGTEVHII